MRAVDDYIENLPDERRELCGILRKLIHSLVPDVEERSSFKIPFYHYFGMFMYLNNTKEGIDVAFCRGKDLTELFPQLHTKGRAIVTTVLIRKKADIYSQELKEIILTAAAWNKEAKELKKPMVKARKRLTK
ncbi:MAG TPA: DUF1801 domain-containing protein [Chitinophagaceae bacterium]|nr:DUF1801 domain-containing protein [Chitinophagaceae bacterium]